MAVTGVFQGTSFITATASGAITEYLAVNRVDTVNGFPIIELADAGEAAAGIATQTVAADSPVGAYAYDGIGKAKVLANSPNIAVGDWLKVGTGGKLVKASTNLDNIVARSMGIATADNAIIDIQICVGTLSVA